MLTRRYALRVFIKVADMVNTCRSSTGVKNVLHCSASGKAGYEVRTFANKTRRSSPAWTGAEVNVNLWEPSSLDHAKREKYEGPETGPRPEFGLMLGSSEIKVLDEPVLCATAVFGGRESGHRPGGRPCV